ncbi:MAG: hypothetical protein M3O82_04560 [Verrucomicrobiota bacterium]|nr:hypothetical protein [Verrucomicrobiota bacterium]
MANVNHAAREVRFKVVFYGPPFSGKRTTIEWIRSHIDAKSVSPFVIANSAADKIVSFNFVLDGFKLIEGYRTRIELCTVGGEVVFNAPRELILQEADSIVFVADPRWESIPANVESLQNLRDNLTSHNRSLATIPHVFQLNKRDLPDVAKIDYIKFLLADGDPTATFFSASARSGENLFPALNAALQPVLEKFAKRHPRITARKQNELPPSRLTRTPITSSSNRS